MPKISVATALGRQVEHTFNLIRAESLGHPEGSPLSIAGKLARNAFRGGDICLSSDDLLALVNRLFPLIYDWPGSKASTAKFGLVEIKRKLLEQGVSA